MHIAVASQDFEHVTGHAGMARRFIVFAAEPGAPPHEVKRIELPQEQTIHSADPDASHPLDEVEVLIAGSAGGGFVNRMAQRGVMTVITAQTDPAQAVADYLSGKLAAPAPHDHSQDHDESEAGGCCCGAEAH
ncbi:Predicted Fe-Mo cluster-binding protein, NifX family [Rhodoblastus acidophilus]|uniref:Predicted Fe-Mo cluster-binding protein, NifX family n=1 Tax=Rhodoblastus acidophilus TaxID=1074 RepID=A0A212RHW9_RHOAC|nr:NifB/NifX family molybdenum-iron cluster-binding protein [Rhodoblastus acidophilus]PPQ38027.1 nitrogen fixation protein [Rhodoblastus acidophilus]RAI24327.1 nitrogen fixation protein [Rhodoblastus acidophilus]SNB71822.1 Predicted Fe-Mo cluster-binding protein, NifX family [Rhodoblastus acidophilus]